MATTVRKREYDERSMDVAGALDYFQRKMAFTTGPVELSRAIENGEVNVVDVRREQDYRAGHIAGATNLPQDRWHTLEGLVTDRPNVLVCYSHVCHLAAHAALEFACSGYPVIELDGGWKEWQRHNLPSSRRQHDFRYRVYEAKPAQRDRTRIRRRSHRGRAPNRRRGLRRFGASGRQYEQ